MTSVLIECWKRLHYLFRIVHSIFAAGSQICCIKQWRSQPSVRGRSDFDKKFGGGAKMRKTTIWWNCKGRSRPSRLPLAAPLISSDSLAERYESVLFSVWLTFSARYGSTRTKLDTCCSRCSSYEDLADCVPHQPGTRRLSSRSCRTASRNAAAVSTAKISRRVAPACWPPAGLRCNRLRWRWVGCSRWMCGRSRCALCAFKFQCWLERKTSHNLLNNMDKVNQGCRVTLQRRFSNEAPKKWTLALTPTVARFRVASLPHSFGQERSNSDSGSETVVTSASAPKWFFATQAVALAPLENGRLRSSGFGSLENAVCLKQLGNET